MKIFRFQMKTVARQTDKEYRKKGICDGRCAQCVWNVKCLDSELKIHIS